MQNNYAIPGAIVIAGVLIAGSLYLVNRPPSSPNLAAAGANNTAEENLAENVRSVSDDDHIRGNPNADIVIVEFSDTECPFCKQFHTTMKRIIDEYGKDGKVAWVYRHFPLESLHPKAPKEAEALECAAELGGEGAFWSYTDKIYEITPANNGLDAAQLPQIAVEVGLNRASFEECLASGRMASRVEEDLTDALNSGGRGTPHSIAIIRGNTFVTIPGAQPYVNVKSLIETALAENSSEQAVPGL